MYKKLRKFGNTRNPNESERINSETRKAEIFKDEKKLGKSNLVCTKQKNGEFMEVTEISCKKTGEAGEDAKEWIEAVLKSLNPQ